MTIKLSCMCIGFLHLVTKYCEILNIFVLRKLDDVTQERIATILSTHDIKVLKT